MVSIRCKIAPTFSRLARLVLLCAFITTAYTVSAQNTKGDRPVNNQRQIKETKSKSVKRKQKSKTKDIAGRRLRTRNKSSANRANSSFPKPDTYPGRDFRTTDRPASPRGRTFTKSPKESRTRAWKGDISGHKLRRIKPSKAGFARFNVYPQNGPYVNNPSRKPRNRSFNVYTKTASGKPIVRRDPPKTRNRAWKGNLKGKRLRVKSATGRIQNTYPQKGGFSLYYSKQPRKRDRAIFGNSNVAGQTRTSRLSKKIQRSGIPLSASGPFVKRGRKNVYWGNFRKGERAFQGDITGGPIRGRNFKSTLPGVVGRDTLKWFGRKPGGDRPYRGKSRRILSVSGQSKAWRNDLAGFKIRSPRKQRGETAGKFVFPRKLSVTQTGRVGRPLRGAGNASRSGKGLSNKPIPGREPGINTFLIGKRMAKTRGNKPVKGGGSISGQYLSDKPVRGREPGLGAVSIGRAMAKTRGKKPIKGGGSVSGQLWNNDETPIQVRKPKSDEMGDFTGNLKVKRGYKQNPNAAELALKKRKPTKNVFDVSGLVVRSRQHKYGKKPNAPDGALPGRTPSKATAQASKALSMKRSWNYKHNPSSADDALMVKETTSAWRKSTRYSGNVKLRFEYRRSPSSADEALKVRYPGKAVARVSSYQGNIKMRKYNDRRFHPDAAFAHTKINNVKGERTFLMDVKLLWAKLFKKNDTQPSNVKDKPAKPRYDKGEKGMWAGDPNYKRKEK